MEQIEFVRNAGETRRFHTWPMLREQNVAAHSWHVTMILWLLYGQCEPGIRMPLMMAGLTHDAPEWLVGDLPAPAKRSMDERIEIKGIDTFRSAWGRMEQDILSEHSLNFEDMLTPEELRMLKLADCMEGALYCIRERAMGNTLIAEPYRNFFSYIEAELGERPEQLEPDTYPYMEWSMRDYINTQWELVNG